MEDLPSILFFGLILFLFVYYLHKGETPADQSPVLNLGAFRDCHLPDLSYRRLEESDATFCRNLFRDLQEAGLSPRGHDDNFHEWLKSEDTKKWMILSESKPIACGGLSTLAADADEEFDDPLAILSFGLMDLDLQKCGLGSLLLALRLWTLPPRDFHFIHLFSTAHSRPYFERFGFVELEKGEQDFEELEGESPLTPLGLWLSSADHQFLDSYLKRHFAQLPTE